MEQTITIDGYTWTKEDIETIYSIYDYNIKQLSKICKIKNTNINNITVNKREPLCNDNDYIRDREYVNNLSKSLLENGWYWLFITKNNRVYEGGHRLRALQKHFKNKEYKILNLDICNADFSKIKLRAPLSKKTHHVKYLGLDYKEYSNINRKNFQKIYIIVPKLLQNVFYMWEQKYGFYPAHKICYEYNAFIEEIDNGHM